MAFASNLAAINAANATLKPAYLAIGQSLDKDALKAARALHFKIEKVDGDWHALIIAPLPEAQPPRSAEASLLDEREGAFAFPTQASLLAEAKAAVMAHPIMQDHLAAKAQAEADALANNALLQAAQESATGKSPAVWITKSSVMKPTKLVWIIADEMIAHAKANNQPLPSRKEVQDECIRRGVASGTARTQYQAWKTASDNANKNAAHAAALSAAFNKR